MILGYKNKMTFNSYHCFGNFAGFERNPYAAAMIPNRYGRLQQLSSYVRNFGFIFKNVLCNIV